MTDLRKTAIELSQVIEGPVPHYPESTNDYVARIPAHRPFYAGDVLVFLPRVQIVVMPIENKGGGWNCVVVAVEPGSSMSTSQYGNRIFVGDAEISEGYPLALTITEVS